MSKIKEDLIKINKNDEFELVIEDIGSDGEGIGRANGYALFIKGGLTGDKVRVKVMKTKKNYGFARIVKILEPSPYRVEPKCPVASQCGGCQLQHLEYSKQLEYKESKVKNSLERIGGFTGIELEPIVGMEHPFRYRNKAQFPVGRNQAGEITIGFYASRTHSVIDTPVCYIQSEVNEIIIAKIRTFLKENAINPYDETTNRGLVRHILTRTGYSTGEIMVCLVLNGNKLPFKEKLIESLITIPGMTSICLNVNRDNTNVILGDKVITLWGVPYITDSIGDVTYRISPLSFYQVNPIQTKKLYEIALDYAGLTGNEVVWDLYCGIGTIGLFLAKNAKKVYGVEIIPQAVEDAIANAKRNGIENAEFFVGAAEELLPEKYSAGKEEMKADVIIVDPPRKGCEEYLLDIMAKMEPKKIVYVSCDPGTLARDLKILCEKGYEVKRVRPVDVFGMGVHVETVVLLIKA